MRNIVLAFAGFGILTACNQTEPTASANQETVELAINTENTMGEMSFYDFKTKTLMGEEFDFSNLKGKRVLIVNTASECGFTPQYEQLQELYKEFGGEKFTVIGFPSNDFGKQEPGSNEEIATFCEKNYGVTFPMMDKTPVKGDDQHEVYSWLTHKDQNGVDDAKVSWNFNKFLVDENGKWVAHYGSKTSPLDEEIVNFAEGN
ncbi:glutathione peroxidase [Owenweeksia hongkongensis]|uniref:glutathione peroxidase n=1 Tax=Owenweeksia hongkongensis TaxID=253245 RepID=UPI003A8D4492